MNRAIALIAVAGCRFGFDARVARDAASDATPDSAHDAAPVDPLGCADGEREAFTDLASYPTIAGCAATWTGELDLRASPTGTVCGDEAGACASPADACSAGWHVCARSGDVTELLALTATDCTTTAGRWAAAADHCKTFDGAMTRTYYPTTATPCTNAEMTTCTQAICCGTGCDPTTMCRDQVWAGATFGNADLGAGCANTDGSTQDGVLCCRD